MTPALLSLVIVFGACPAGEPTSVGTLWPRHRDRCLGSGTAYQPQEGDILFFSSCSLVYTCIFGVGRTGHPWHIGLVVRNDSGELCVFESGGPAYWGVSLVSLEGRLRGYLAERKYRRIWVRRLKHPLTAEQAQRLREFARWQEGKRFASHCRMAAQGLPTRPLRPTDPDQSRWFCAELVAEAIRQAQLCPACWMVPEKTTPRELFTDARDVSCGWHLPETWSPDCDPPPPGPLCAPL